MRVLIAWANDSSANLGVRALAQGSVDLIRSAYPNAQFTYLNYGLRPAQVPWSTRGLFRERLTGRLGMMAWLRQFDFVWDTRSGDSFADIYGMPRHETMSLIYEFAAQAGVPVVLAPQTIGPFRTRRSRALARRNLRKSSLVFARDELSAQASADLGRTVDAVTSDLVFGIAQPEPGQHRDVLLNVSGLLWRENPHVDSERYRAAVRRIIDGLLETGRDVTLLPHVVDSPDPDNDVPVSHALVEEYGSRIDVHVPSDLDDVRSTVAAAELVIGARMHACLNALSTGTPAIAMAYSRKFAPLLESVGWEHVVPLSGSEDWADQVLALAARRDLRGVARHSQATGRRLLDPVVTALKRLP